MDNIEFRAHVISVISFLRTLVVKCEVVADSDNKLLEEAGYPVSSDKRQWRYYLNMAGEYHPTDDPMYITSVDNGETILFNKPNLEDHLSTLTAYQPGSYYYNRLTEEYPHQIDLIHGILDPIDIDFAINSEDYRILRYNKKLLDRNEEQLIKEIQEWVNSFCNRTLKYNEYLYTDNLMLPTLLALLYGSLITLVLTVRLEAYGTRYVNEYHIWSKLNSHGDFNPYRKLLTHDQKMWLYRNIEWCKRTTGQSKTFDALIANLLTPADIPLDHYDSTINTKDLVTVGTGTGVFTKTPLNFIDNTADDNRFTSVKEMSDKGINQALDNALLQDEQIEEVDETLRYGVYSQMSSKIVESSMEDYTNRHADTLMKTLMHEWVYLLKHDRYKAVIDLNNPQTGESFRLNVKDALILWQYLTTRARGEDTTYIQPFFYQSVMRIERPDLQTLMDAGDIRYLPEYICRDIRKLWVASPRIISPETFFDFCFDIHSIRWKSKKVYCKFMDIYRHARTKEATERLFERGLAVLNDEATYDEWFLKHELNFDLFSQEDCLLLAWDIFQKGTAWNTKATASLRQIQSNLINLMKEMASYTVQYVTDMNDGNNTIEGNQRRGMHFNEASGMSNESSVNGRLLFPHDVHVVSDHSLSSTLEAINSRELPHRALGIQSGYMRAESRSFMRVVKPVSSNKVPAMQLLNYRKMTENNE